MTEKDTGAEREQDKQSTEPEGIDCNILQQLLYNRRIIAAFLFIFNFSFVLIASSVPHRAV